MLKRPVTVVEVEPFPRLAERVWSEDERLEFVDFIAWHADDGEVIPGLSGIRIIRWRREGIGKRGGVRVVYFFYDEELPVYLLRIYAKSEKSDLSAVEKKLLRPFAESVKRMRKGKLQ